jgi:hypothetical protein
VVSEGRTFYYASKGEAIAVGRVLADVRRVSRPGSRLFVGPLDLRRTPYNEAEFYHFLSEWVPATYFIDLHPGVALRHGAQLARELASADVAVLSPQIIDEPNQSRLFGSDAGNRVLARAFCLVSTHRQYRVFVKCQAGQVTSPQQA